MASIAYTRERVVKKISDTKETGKVGTEEYLGEPRGEVLGKHDYRNPYARALGRVRQ